MKIGILSDTHGNISAVETAARAFREAGAGAVFHCGDIGGYDVLAKLAEIFHPLKVVVNAVLGNVDVHCCDWDFFPTTAGIRLHGRFGEIELEGWRIALLHGDDRKKLGRVAISGNYDLVLSGHSHAVHDFLEGKTRCINPGTAGRGTSGTCAVLDLASGELKIFGIAN